MEITHAEFQLITGAVITVLFFAFAGIIAILETLNKKK
jgi:hypothetical protein